MGDFKQFNPNQANALSDSSYNTNSQRTGGLTSGQASSQLHNKAFYQWSTMVTALADAMVAAGFTVSDSDLAALTAVVSNLIYPVGCVIWVPSTTPPNGFIKANGALLSRSTYAALWAYAQTSGNIASSDAYCQEGQFSTGDGSTTFRIPDLRGNFMRGYDDGRGIDTGRSLGSLEQATGIQQYLDIADANAPFLVSGPDEDGTWISYASPLVNPPGTSAGNMAYGTFYRQGFRTRPRNVAFLACIKY